MFETMRDAFGRVLVELADQRDDFVVMDADVAGGTGTAVFRQAYPHRFIQCGIAEQNMFAAAAGLASTGLIPVVTCYAIFAAMRALDQARNAIAYPNFNVKIAVSHLGLDVGPDGATHQCLEDISIYRAIPNMRVISPADPVELAALVPWMLDNPGPCYLRTGRSPLPRVFEAGQDFPPGKALRLRSGDDVAILAVGVMVHRALVAAQMLEAEGINSTVLNMSWIKPLDTEAVTEAAQHCGAIVTAEDHTILGGLGGAVAEVLGERCPVPLQRVGIRDVFGESGEPGDLARAYGLDAPSIAQAVRGVLRRKATGCWT